MKFSSLVVLGLLLAAETSFAAVPQHFTLNLQVFDQDSPNGFSYTGALTAELFTAPTGGTSLWKETHPSATIDRGFLSLQLGTGTNLTPLGKTLPEVLLAQAASGKQSFLELRTKDQTLPQRMEIGSVPYALACSQADNAVAFGGKAQGEFSLSGHTHAWDGITGKPTTFAPAAHNHDGAYLPAAGKAVDADKLDGQDSAAFALATALQTALTRLDKAEAKIGELQGTVMAQATTIASLQKQVSCPSDMVKVGDFCIDRVEASLWTRNDGAPVDCELLQKAVDTAKDSAGTWKWQDSDFIAWYKGQHGTCLAASGPKPDLCQYRQYGTPPGCNNPAGCDDYPSTFPDTGNWTKSVYSCAILGIAPSRSLTWFQAQQACVASGRALCTNGDWQAAAAGTPDPRDTDPGDDSEPCNIWSNSKPKLSAWAELNQTTKTGAAPACKSAYGAFDMVGNLWEWVDMWGQAGRTKYDIDGGKFYSGAVTTPWPAGFGGDQTLNINGEADNGDTFTIGLPAAARRGGTWSDAAGAGVFSLNLYGGPSYWSHTFGARCCLR